MYKNLKIIIAILSLAVIALAILLYKKSNPTPTPTESKTTVEQTKKTVVPVSITKKEISETNFSGSKPLIEGSSVLVKEANKYIEQTIADFRTTADNDVPDMRAKFGSDSPTTNYSIDTEAKYIKSNSTESIVLNQYMYTGGANGNSIYKVFTASLKTGKNLSITDEIKPEKQTAFLALLKKKLLAWRPEGSTQSVVFSTEVNSLTMDSLRNWSLDQKNLTIYFDKYAIGPGVLGPVAFTIPLDTLKDFLVYN